MILHHAFCIEFFDDNQTEAVDKPAGSLVNKIMAAKSDTLVNTTHNLHCLTAFLTAMLLFAEFALCFRQSLLVLAEELGIDNELPIRESGELVQPHVYTNSFIGRGKRLLLYLNGKADIPLLALPPNSAGFYTTFDGAVEDGFDVTYLGQVDGLLAYLEPCLGVCETVVSAAFEARKTGSVPTLDTGKERFERKVYPNSNILQNLTEHACDFGELFRPDRKVLLLFITRGRRALYFIIVLAFVEQAVVHVPTHIQSTAKSLFLSGCGC